MKFAGIGVAAALVAVTLVGCSSSSSKDSSAGGASGSSLGSAGLGTENKATGSKITFGYISEGKSAAIDQSDEFKGAKAAAAYANEYLGGANGHEIEIKTCEALATAAQTTDCANQMVQANVAAVIGGPIGQTDALVDVMSKAGIPVIFQQASSAKVLSTPGVFSLTNPLTYFGAGAAYSKEKKFKSAVQLVIDVPGAAGPAKSLGGLLFKNVGVDYSVVAIPAGTADMTPQVQTSQKNNPDLYNILGNAAFCTSALKALKTLAVKATIMMGDQCIAVGQGSSIPDGYAGIKVITTLELADSNPDYRTFLQASKKYDEEAKSTRIAATGYSVTLATIRALIAAKMSDTTPAAVLAGIKSAPAVPFPMEGGGTFQCNGSAMKTISVNICSVTSILADSDKAGVLSNYEVVDGSGIYG
ncbi:MAG: hypothetical protein JWM76_3954 [Pseudonocardiales bacterium]|nr:hypothetical protein [Pseudonocardiales bacterium]